MTPPLLVFLILTGLNLLLMACPVRIDAAFREELFLRVGYLFFHYTVSPKEKAKNKPAKSAGKPKKNRVAELYHAKGLSGFLKILGRAAKIAGSAAKGVFTHIYFARFLLEIRVAGEDAAKTAVDYGCVCGIVGPAASLMLGHAKCRDCRIRVVPDFCSEKSSVEFSMKARVAVFFLVQTALRALIQSVRLIKDSKAADYNAERNNTVTESGVIHGGTSH